MENESFRVQNRAATFIKKNNVNLLFIFQSIGLNRHEQTVEQNIKSSVFNKIREIKLETRALISDQHYSKKKNSHYNEFANESAV